MRQNVIRLCLLSFALFSAAHSYPRAHAAALVEIDDDDDDGAEVSPAKKSPATPPPKKARASSRRKAPPNPPAKAEPEAPETAAEPVEEPKPAVPESVSEASGPDRNGICHNCGAPIHNPPGTPDMIDVVADAFRSKKPAPPRKSVNLLEQNGKRMSCAQRNLLEGAKRLNCRKYSYHHHFRDYSRGDCGGGVGASIVEAHIPFEKGPRRDENGRMIGRTRFAKDYMSFMPEYHFTKIDVASVEEAPEGSVLVFAGPCTVLPRGVHIRRAKCDPRRYRGNGERVGHVTIKGSPSMDGDKQNYYTDGQTRRPAIDRRYFIGAFLPPGSDAGPCARTTSPASGCN